MLVTEIKTLLWKELVLEWRHKYAINGILLYTLSTIFICYMSFNVLNAGLNSFTWNALFWIITLFSATTAIAKSFIQENQNRQLYYYTLVSPEGIILSKIIYNTGLLVVLAFVGLALFSLVLGNPVQDLLLFVVNLLLTTLGFSITLTLISGIAAKAENNGMLMAVLSFPVIIPILLMAIKISKNAIDGIARSESLNELLTLGAVNLIMGSLAYMLFPYLWRS